MFSNHLSRLDPTVPQSVISEKELISRLPGLDRLWLLTKGRPEVRIAILDGPVDSASVARTHVQPSGVVDHGTMVQSIISGSADTLAPGIAPGCTVVSIPIFEPASEDAPPSCTQSDLAKAIQTALDERANIINISASQQADALSLTSALSQSLQEAARRDVLVVAAAGNQGCACDTIPASVAGVLAVGAHDKAGAPLLSSNWGPGQRTQGLVAPGQDVAGACVGGGLCRASGTSFAAATVSGVAALLMSADLERGIKPSGSRVRKLLLGSAHKPRSDEVELAGPHLAGRLDVSRAVDTLISSAPLRPREEALSIESLPHEDEQQPAPTRPGKSTRVRKADRAGMEPAPQDEERSTGLVPADCGCGGEGAACSCHGAEKNPQLVYAIGRLGVSFQSPARRDSIWRIVNGAREGDLKPISNGSLQELFKKQPYQAQSVIWTLSRTEVPMYAIVPTGAFAAETYKWLVNEWEDSDVEFASIPGVLAGQIALYDGQIVDAVIPDLRGMFSWETKRYVKALRDARKRAEGDLSDTRLDREIERFFGKIYFTIRNRGQSPEERAINAAATNAFNVSPVIEQAGEEGLTLRDIGVERSPFNRPGSEYYDVLLTFFDPRDRQGVAPLRARFTIDVSDTVPVMIGEPVLAHEY
jgi:cyanobactin maturation PatA/PatG family protease